MKKRVILIAIVGLFLLMLPMIGEAKTIDSKNDSIPFRITQYQGYNCYELTCTDDLFYWNNHSSELSNVNFVLANDIAFNTVTLSADASGNLSVDPSQLVQWTPINGFSGRFFGNNHTISGLFVKEEGRYAGFFGSNLGSIYNLSIKNAYVSGRDCVGGLCGYSGGVGEKIKNCIFSGTVVGNDSVGGIVGNMHCNYLSNCTNNGIIIGKDQVAGIVGHFFAYSIESCVNNGNVTGSNFVGGIVGDSQTYDLINCINRGNIKGDTYVGGLSGSSAKGYMSGNNSGKISGNKYVGGLIGSFTYCVEISWQGDLTGANIGSINGNEYVGGIVGYLNYSNILDSICTGTVSGENYVGKIVGMSESVWGNGSVKNCYYTRNTGDEHIGLGNTTEDNEDSTKCVEMSTFCIHDGWPTFHTLVMHEKLEPTCAEAGTEAYWSCDTCNKLFSDSEAIYVIDAPIIIPATGHTLTAHPPVEATCTETGMEAYWSCDVCNLLFSDSEATTEITAPVDIPALGHNWKKPTYEWTKDYNQVTASRICKNDNTHEETETVKTTSKKKAATYTKAGSITYTAKFENPAFKKQTKKVTIPKLPVDIKQDGNKYHLDPKKKTAIFTGVEKKTATKLTIPDTIVDNGTTFKVTEITANACKGLKKLLALSIGKNVKTIGANAFNGCTKLKTVYGGVGLVTIGDSAFQGCSALTAITLNKNVKTIGKKAFYNCKKLAQITVKTTKLTDKTVGSNAFGGIYKKATFKCPKSKLKAYKKLFLAKGAPSKATFE